MKNVKPYKEMSPEEQLKWLTDFSEFAKEKLPALCQLGNAWEASSMKSFEEGLMLMDAFAYCREFVRNSLMFRDFSRRVDRMKYYVERIKKEISSGTVVHGVNGETLAYVPSLRPAARRRGRPTDAEVRDALLSAEKNKMEEERAKLLAELNDSIIVAGVSLKKEDEETDTKGQEKPAGGPDLFSQAAAMSAGGARLHLDQLKWLLSPTLAADVEQVHSLRESATYEAEKAKQLALAGANEETIAPHSRAACEYTDKYKSIYDAVDEELAFLYMCLDIEPDFGEYKAEMERRGSNLATLQAVLFPYFTKKQREEGWVERNTERASLLTASKFEVGSLEIREKISDSLPCFDEEEARLSGEPTINGVATERDSVDAGNVNALTETERKQRLHKIRTYIMRKDTNLTAKRIENMEQKIAEAEALGEDVSAYNAILDEAKKNWKALENDAVAPTEEEE